MKEKNIQSLIMLAVSKAGSVIFRNSSGAYKTDDGRFIRYGLGNPGGSDLIGWMETTITNDMVGEKVAIFTAIEVKTPKGRATKEQLRFIEAVRNAGGIAGIARSVEDALDLIRG